MKTKTLFVVGYVVDGVDGASQYVIEKTFNSRSEAEKELQNQLDQCKNELLKFYSEERLEIDYDRGYIQNLTTTSFVAYRIFEIKVEV